MICPICGAFSINRYDLMDHLYDEHSIECARESLTFQSHEQFTSWKTKVEKDAATRFQEGAPYKRKDGSKYLIFTCSRQRSTKTFCPAYFSINERADGSVSVDFVKTHVGHDGDIICKTETEEPARNSEKSPQHSERGETDDDPTVEDYALFAYEAEQAKSNARAVEACRKNMTQLWDYVREEVVNCTTIKELQVFETLVRPIVPTLRVIREAETKAYDSPSSSHDDSKKRKSTTHNRPRLKKRRT